MVYRRHEFGRSNNHSVFTDVDYAVSKPTDLPTPQPDENSVGSDEDVNEAIGAPTNETSTLAVES